MTLATSATGRDEERGFTLLELLVVIAIVALLASAFPFALDRALPMRRLAVTIQGITTALVDARAESAACSCPMRLTLRDHLLAVSAVSSSHAMHGPQGVSIPHTIQVSLTDMNGRPMHSIEIFPDGSSSGARFEALDGQHRSGVSVSELTGRIVVARAQ